MNDIRHLYDYVVYRLTKSNVGPWGLSKQTERHPVYLSPALSATVPVSTATKGELTRALERIEQQDDTSSAAPDLARLFPPPERTETLAELVFDPTKRNGRGLFGSSEVYVEAAPSGRASAEVEQARRRQPGWSLPEATEWTPVVLHGGGREIRTVARKVRIASEENQ